MVGLFYFMGCLDGSLVTQPRLCDNQLMSLDPNYDPDSICQAKCTTPLGDPVCRGCGRTFEEVTHWVTYTYEQKMKVVARIRGEQMREDKG